MSFKFVIFIPSIIHIIHKFLCSRNQISLLGCLALWALLETCHWAAQILVRDPNATGVVLLKSPIEMGILYRVEVVQIKNHIEVFVGLISMFLVLAGRCAPIFPVFYWQYLRVKYVVNYFTKESFYSFDQKILKTLFPGMMYKIFIERAKKVVRYLINYQEGEDSDYKREKNE